MKTAIEVKDLWFHYSSEAPYILKNINFSLDKGDTLGIIGLSGCGKSTLCHCLCGIIPHNQDGLMEGDVLLFGRNTRALSLPKIATEVGIVFQDPESQLFLPRIEDELVFGPENLCIPAEKIKEVVHDVCNLTQINHLLHKSPDEISGGQMQISALAAVLCLNPKILILDEVTSQLDRESCLRIENIIRALKEMGKTIVMVEHNLERLKIADKIIALRNDGGIMAIGDANEILNSRNVLEACYLLN